MLSFFKRTFSTTGSPVNEKIRCPDCNLSAYRPQIEDHGLVGVRLKLSGRLKCKLILGSAGSGEVQIQITIAVSK